MSDTERSYSGTLIAAILLIVMVAGVAYRYWPSDERVIRRHLSNLAEALSFPLTETDEERLTRLAVLREYFSPDVRVRIDGRELTSRDEVIAQLTAVRPPPGGIEVEFVDIIVALGAEGETATVTLTAKMSSTTNAGESTLDQRVADVTMRKIDDDWVIAAAALRATTAATWRPPDARLAALRSVCETAQPTGRP